MVARKGAGFQRRYLHSGRIRGGITQLSGDATAVIGCWTWVKRAFILPILSDGFSLAVARADCYRFLSAYGVDIKPSACIPMEE